MTTLEKYNDRAGALGGRPQFRAVVLSIHGINTTGPWQKNIVPILARHAFMSAPVDYGFAVLKTLRPKQLLAKATEAALRMYANCLIDGVPFSAIGHSFGTLALGSLIEDNRDATFDRVITVGSILRTDFPWASAFESGQVGKALNEISTDDPVVRICPALRVCSPGLKVGRSGKLGFDCKHLALIQRQHKLGHSGVLNELAVSKTWIPFLRKES